MVETKQNLIQAFFDDHKDRVLEFIIVTDINMKEHPNYYKAIFRDLKSGTEYSHEIVPEMINSKYKPGYIFINGEMIGKNESLMSDEFHIENPQKPLVRLATIIGESDVKLIEYDELDKYLLRQYAYVDIQEDCTLIVPCYTIANRFYFLNSSLKKAVMNGRLDDLYYKGSFRHVPKDDGKIKIEVHIKKQAGTTHLSQICRFLDTTFSQDRFQYISTQKAQMKKEHTFAPIKAQFPISTSFQIKASYIYIGDDSRGKPKYMILHISSDNIGYRFDAIDYKIYKEGEDPRIIDPNSKPIPGGIPPRKPKKRAKRTDKIYSGTPLDEYTVRIQKDFEDEDLFDNVKVEINGRAIYIPRASISEEKDTDKEDKPVDNSFEHPDKDGDADLGSLVYGNIPKTEKKQKIPFRLHSFYEFYETLLTYSEVYGNDLNEPEEIGKVEHNKRKSIINSETNQSRQFLSTDFLYGRAKVYIVEIEQDSSWQPSTWIFVDPIGHTKYSSVEMKELIECYLEENFTYKKLKEYVLKFKGLHFLSKNHQKEKKDEISIGKWCDGVLFKIDVCIERLTGNSEKNSLTQC